MLLRSATLKYKTDFFQDPPFVILLEGEASRGAAYGRCLSRVVNRGFMTIDAGTEFNISHFQYRPAIEVAVAKVVEIQHEKGVCGRPYRAIVREQMLAILSFYDEHPVSLPDEGMVVSLAKGILSFLKAEPLH